MTTVSMGHNSSQFDLEDEPVGDWIALSRKVREHPVVGVCQPVKPADAKKGSCSRFEAWFDLLCLAQWRPSRINNKGEVQTLDVGQLMGALPFLAGRWNWTVATVRWFLATLEGEGMISRSSPTRANHDRQTSTQANSRSTNKCAIITIENYTKYQVLREEIGSYVQHVRQQANDRRAAGEQQANDRNLTRKTNKQINNPPTPQGGADRLAEQFDEFWSSFPGWAPPRGRKTDKPKAMEVFKRIVLNRHRKGLRATADEIVAGAKRYAQSSPDPEFIPMPTTWLNGGRWADGSDSDANENLVGPNGKSWGWWRGMEDKLHGLSADHWRKALDEHRPNGTWPWWLFGAPPGHPECVMPEAIIVERGYLEIYRGQIKHD